MTSTASRSCDGYTHSIVPGVEPLNGVDALAGRFTLLYQPIENLTATLKFAASRSAGHALRNTRLEQ